MADLMTSQENDQQEGQEYSESKHDNNGGTNPSSNQAASTKSDTRANNETDDQKMSRRKKKNKKRSGIERRYDTDGKQGNHQQEIRGRREDVTESDRRASQNDSQSEPYSHDGERNEINHRQEGGKDRHQGKDSGRNQQEYRGNDRRNQEHDEHRDERRKGRNDRWDGQGRNDRWERRNEGHGADDENWRSGNKRSEKQRNKGGGGDNWRDQHSVDKGQGHDANRGQGHRKENREGQGKYYRMSEEDKQGYHFFYQDGSVFSQWHRAWFVVEGTEYNCTEQYMMHQKAVLMNDMDSADYILGLSDPRKQKEAGRGVQYFDQRLWDAHCYDIVRHGNYAKFSQNENMKKELLATYPKTLVETNPFDKIWGIGLNKDDPKAKVKAQWRGRNLLGYALTEVRDRIMKEGNTAQSSTGRNASATSDPQPPREGQPVMYGGGMAPPPPAMPTGQPSPGATKDWFDEETPDTYSTTTSSVPLTQPRTEECFLMMETTSADKDSDLLQISAVSTSGSFDRYVIPTKPISKEVEEKTGIKYNTNQMTVSGRQVQTVSVNQALKELVDFLDNTPKYVIGHNMKSMGCYVLINAATPLGLNENLKTVLKNMYDVSALARHVDANLKSTVTLEELSERILGKDTISHDASQDVKELQKMYHRLSPDEDTKSSCVFHYENVMNAKKFTEEKNKNFESWKPLTAKGIMPKKAAEKAAGHGMTVESVLGVYRTGGTEVITAMFTEMDENTNHPKVTDKKETIHQLCQYFDKLKTN